MDSDSDEDWEISSNIVVPSKKPVAPPVNNRNNQGRERGGKVLQGASANWAAGNPNRVVEEKEKEVNPVEIWLKDAIDYIDDDGVMSSFSDELKESLLEQEKGKIFDAEPDERDMIEEEELQELVNAFRGEDDNAFKNPFIQIGSAYRRQTEAAPGERADRKVVNYRKMKPVGVDSDKFSFFDNEDQDDFATEENNKNSLARWMREDDVSMWPLSARLQAHAMWGRR